MIKKYITGPISAIISITINTLVVVSILGLLNLGFEHILAKGWLGVGVFTIVAAVATWFNFDGPDIKIDVKEVKIEESQEN